ncbi:hypothetical protein GCM10027298_33780 [Epidermidibacterium keratini]
MPCHLPSKITAPASPSLIADVTASPVFGCCATMISCAAFCCGLNEANVVSTHEAAGIVWAVCPPVVVGAAEGVDDALLWLL